MAPVARGSGSPWMPTARRACWAGIALVVNNVKVSRREQRKSCGRTPTSWMRRNANGERGGARRSWRWSRRPGGAVDAMVL